MRGNVNNKYEVFKSIKLDQTGLISLDRSNLFRIYCRDNNIVTVQDIVDLCKKHINDNNCNLTTATMCGLINLCAYKYCDTFSKSVIDLLNSKFDFFGKRSMDTEVRKDLAKFCYLGLTFNNCRYLYEYSRLYPGKTIIEYIREIMMLNSDSLVYNERNVYHLLIDYYDSYEKKNVNKVSQV